MFNNKRYRHYINFQLFITSLMFVLSLTCSATDTQPVADNTDNGNIELVFFDYNETTTTTVTTTTTTTTTTVTTTTTTSTTEETTTTEATTITEATEPVIIETETYTEAIVTEPIIIVETTETDSVIIEEETTEQQTVSVNLANIPFDYDLNLFTYNTAVSYGLPYEFVLAVIKMESGFNTYASSWGLMGISPRYNSDINLTDPYQNIPRGCQILQNCYNKAGGDLLMTYTYYNCGLYCGRTTPNSISYRVYNYYTEFLNR